MNRAYRFYIVNDTQQSFGALMKKDIPDSVILNDEKLRQIAREAIMSDKNWECLVTSGHKVICDVGISKFEGGLGASQPIETVLLFK